MSERARQLHASADRQIGALIEIASALAETSLRFLCTGRAKRRLRHRPVADTSSPRAIDR
jgi:hypothetical protein